MIYRIPLWAQALILLLFVVLLRVAQIDREPHFDELYHLLAARSWAAEGALQIAEGVYTRTSLYTMMLGWLFRLFEDSLVVARLPSVLFGSLWVVVVFLWTRRVASPSAAWIAALIFAIAPGAIAISQFTRFYALHGFAFALGTIAVYTLVTRRLSPAATVATAAGAAAAYACAFYLQLTTAIGLAGVAAWLAVEIALRLIRGEVSRVGKAVIGIALALGLIAAAILLQTGIAADLFHMYRSTQLWDASEKNNVEFYFRLFLADYPTFWTLVPLAALIAMARRPEPARLCVILFGTAFMLHSFAGMKLERYIYYVVPFFFVIWGIALAELLPHLHRLIVWSVDRILHLPRPSPIRTWMNRTAVAAVLILVLGSNIGFPRGIRMVVSDAPLLYGDGSNWPAAADRLKAAAGEADILVTTDDLRAIYYIGDYDVLINRSRLAESAPVDQFTPDPRTGRPVISEPEALRRILECYPSGLIIAPAVHWRRWEVLDEAMANLILDRAEPIPVPDPWNMRVYRWEHRQQTTADCSSLRKLVSVGE